MFTMGYFPIMNEVHVTVCICLMYFAMHAESNRMNVRTKHGISGEDTRTDKQ